MDKLEILKAKKPEKINIIEQSQNIEILAEKQEREPLKRQLVDNIVVEGNDRDNNEIQSANKVEILRSSKPKKQNSIEDNCNLFIPPIEKKPLNQQIVDNIIIEGIVHPENIIQNLDKIELIKNPKIIPENKISLIDSIYLPQKDLDLIEQKIDNLLIQSMDKPENEIQKLEKVNILKSTKPKPPTTIEHQDLFIPQKEKAPLNSQTIDKLLIEGETKPETEIQKWINLIY